MTCSEKQIIGKYVSFKSIKSPEEAVKRLISDWKKFGIKSSRYFEKSQLLQGFGEAVWYLINDLLNRELIRRDYKFQSPIIKDDSDNEESQDFEEEKDAHTFKFDFNMQNGKTPGIGRKTTAKNIEVSVENGMITQTNFGLNYNKNSLTRKFSIEKSYEQEEFDESMINCNVDPLEWQKEVTRVEEELQQFYKNQDIWDEDPFHECLGLAKTAKSHLTKDLRKTLDNIIDEITNDLNKITKEESRLNNCNFENISKS